MNDVIFNGWIPFISAVFGLTFTAFLLFDNIGFFGMAIQILCSFSALLMTLGLLKIRRVI